MGFKLLLSFMLIIVYLVIDTLGEKAKENSATFEFERSKEYKIKNYVFKTCYTGVYLTVLYMIWEGE